ncbi:plasmid replication protein RepC [Terrarubrum flagellatum]|uniref:plasmid replication protein RepC n=1 Tax=Terrirubrum flagellatum TaxID=2895980 RepID=UPI0031455073
MAEHLATTPFGRRPAKLTHIATQKRVAQAIADAAKPGSNQPAAVHKWALFRSLTEAKERLGVSDRALGVLNALLSFHQETALSLPIVSQELQQGAGEGASCDLVVFPSNRMLCLRAHGMAEQTLRRHLAALVEAGLIARRDSPNGKRYARKDPTGAERFSDAFGFDLAPLVARASEIEGLADEVRRERQAIRMLKERITLHRRDIAKLIGLGLDEEMEGPWEDIRTRYMGLVAPFRTLRGLRAFETIERALAALRVEVDKWLEKNIDFKISSGNDSQTERHQSNSNHPTPDVEPASKEARGEIEPTPESRSAPPDPLRAYPLGMVLDACPDVRDYASGGQIRSWETFLETVRLIRPMLGISPDAWHDAIEAMGEGEAAVAVATILQRCEHSSEAAPVGDGGIAVNGSPAIRSAGGYLRSLTDKARAGEFSVGPVLMALIGQRLKARRGRARQ